MREDANLDSEAPSISRARRWLVRYPRAVPIAIFLAIAAITALSVFAIESNARARENAQVEEYATSVASALERRGNSYSSYIRAGAAFFSSFDEVRPQMFRQFVAELRLDVEYRGAEGIGWIEVVQPDDFTDYLARNRAAHDAFEGVRPNPGTPTSPLAPVTYFSPDTERNRRALGFDMYSDPVRAAALEEARRTVRPTASGRVVLAQEGADEAPGFLIFMPVYKAVESDQQLAGFVYSPFNAARFLDSAIDLAEPSELGVRLYDGEAGTDNLLVSRSLDNPGRRQVEQLVTIANRQLLLVVDSPRIKTLAPLSMVTLLFGIAVASLLMLLVRLQTQQALEDQTRLAFFEEQYSIRNSLTRELNHRVKNTLANVLSIMSLTRRRTNDLDEFADSLDGRIRALSATHDLLTRSDWGTIPLRAVIEAELQHFNAVSDHAMTLEGPAVELAPNNALSFGLAVHELGTNAAKFGALSVAGGSVSVTWRLVDEELAEVEWCEREGPVVSASRERGFGTDLIEKIVALELKQPVQLDFDPQGVRCIMRVPIRRLSDFQIRQDRPGS
ncbi:CHASE domain-containing protein [uncultured Erythrobacter sp.]|uniref:CHASE domain-containing protein n=1 Tax=uncultured Erythrobacter sp. TaxID=263913 RepID=UPI002613B804|nr:CHASE domain-containing protein [uncultured Erythrobacter sp.]